MNIKKILLSISAFLVTLAGGYGISTLGAGSYSVINVFDNIATSTTGNALFSNDYRNVVCYIVADSTTATIKFAGSISESAPDPTLAQSTTNTFDNIQIVDKQNGVSIDGDTGISFTGTDDQRMVVLNSDLLSWVIPYTSSFTTTTGNGIYMDCLLGNNQ
jgi:hypothetical protein